MGAIVRDTEIAKRLEDFLDSNEEDLSPRMFQELEGEAEVIDDMVNDKDNYIDELEERVKELQEQVEELQERLERLEDE